MDLVLWHLYVYCACRVLWQQKTFTDVEFCQTTPDIKTIQTLYDQKIELLLIPWAKVPCRMDSSRLHIFFHYANAHSKVRNCLNLNYANFDTISPHNVANLCPGCPAPRPHRLARNLSKFGKMKITKTKLWNKIKVFRRFAGKTQCILSENLEFIWFPINPSCRDAPHIASSVHEKLQ